MGERNAGQRTDRRSDYRHQREEDTEHRDLAVDITQQAGVDFTNLIANADFAPILKDVIGVPTTLFIDGDGNIVGDPIVGADVDGYKTFVEDYLSEQ